MDKTTLREEARRRRSRVAAGTSARVIGRLWGLPAWQRSRRVCVYVSTGDEVDTRDLLGHLWAGEREVSVPYCELHRLRLSRIDSPDQLAPGRFSILEPRPEIRREGSRHVPTEEVELFLVPGVAFTRDGRRLGTGWGFYDRLLAEAAEGAVAVGLAFECQIFPTLPTVEHDVPMDYVVTEAGIYRSEPE